MASELFVPLVGSTTATATAAAVVGRGGGLGTVAARSRQMSSTWRRESFNASASREAELVAERAAFSARVSDCTIFTNTVSWIRNALSVALDSDCDCSQSRRTLPLGLGPPPGLGLLATAPNLGGLGFGTATPPRLQAPAATPRIASTVPAPPPPRLQASSSEASSSSTMKSGCDCMSSSASFAAMVCKELDTRWCF